MKTRHILLIISSCFLFMNCKPTEKGYKSAYDAALGKREALKNDIDIDLPEGALQQVDGPQLKNVNGIDVYVFNHRIKPAEGSEVSPYAYNVAVGKYQMITNAKAQSQALKGEGFNSFPAEDSEQMYYSIAGSFPTLEEAVTFYEKYRQGKGRVYIGLPNAPVIIYSP